MTIDFLRSCYATNMRFFPGDLSRLSGVFFYFSRPGAKVLPFETAFASRNYARGWAPTPGGAVLTIGEWEGGRAWYGGQAPNSYSGRRTCTPAVVWLNGAPALVPGFDADACCQIREPLEVGSAGGLGFTPTFTPGATMLAEVWSGGSAGQSGVGSGAGPGGVGGNYAATPGIPCPSGTVFTIVVGGTAVACNTPANTSAVSSGAGPTIWAQAGLGGVNIGTTINLGGTGGTPSGGSGGGGGGCGCPGGAGNNAAGRIGGAAQTDSGAGGNGAQAPMGVPSNGGFPGGGGGGKRMGVGPGCGSGAAGWVRLTGPFGVQTFTASGTYTIP